MEPLAAGSAASAAFSTSMSRRASGGTYSSDGGKSVAATWCHKWTLRSCWLPCRMLLLVYINVQQGLRGYLQQPLWPDATPATWWYKQTLERGRAICPVDQPYPTKVSHAGRTCPKRALSVLTPGALSLTRSSTADRADRLARSHLLITTTSAARNCRHNQNSPVQYTGEDVSSGTWKNWPGHTG